MSKAGYPYDNATMERYFNSLKCELIYIHDYKSDDELDEATATWIYIDEVHVLLNSAYTARYLQQLWKKVRKQGGLCTGIMQNLMDLLQDYTAATMLANSEFIALLKQANLDTERITEVVEISEAQLRFVTNTLSGMGLLKCGSVVVPFDNTVAKENDLYRLYNTNLFEKGEIFLE